MERNLHPDDEEISDHVEFFSHLTGQLTGLKEWLDETLEQEGRQFGTFVASRLLSRLHHRDPSFPVDAVHEKISPATAREDAEAAVASHVARIVAKLRRQE